MPEPIPPTGQRRLAAVMFLDVVGYSALMSRSESSALDCIKEFETILRAEVPAAGGRLVKFMGDGSLAEFPTAGAAVNCAQRILDAVEACRERRAFDIRIGLHLGEVVEDKGDIFGDAVNIAARIQPLADPGGIAMSGTVHAQVKNQAPLRGAYLPPTRLKNIPDRLSIFAVAPRGHSLLAWKVRRRGLNAALPFVVVLAVAAGGWIAWRRHAASAPTITLFYVHPPDDSPAWRKRALEFDERMIFRGSTLKGFRWLDRDLALTNKGLAAVEDMDVASPGAKTRACVILREIGIDYAIYSYIGKGPKHGWKVDYALIDSKKTDIVGSDTVEADDLDGLAKGVVARLTAWNSAGRPAN